MVFRGKLPAGPKRRSRTLDIAVAGILAALLARTWESALLVKVENDTLRCNFENSEAITAAKAINTEQMN